jgi:TolB-like protein
MLIYERRSWRNPAGESIPEKSIAVLPFDNLSVEQENAFFAEAVQDEILADLARIADLKVISRTSVTAYKSGSGRNLREIGRELGVAHILEGTAQRVANRVRVTVQLIDARTDAHLWAEKYDRPLDDVFLIQSGIARAIADQLRAKLSAAEKASIEERPTHDLEAYDFYLRAKELVRDLDVTIDAKAEAAFSAAIELLEKAVARDRNFALAYCALVDAELTMFWTINEQPQHRIRAETALQMAVRLAPEAGETHLAQARFNYYGKRDYDRALEELEIAGRSLPNNTEVLTLSARLERRLGRWQESVRHFERVIELDPRNPIAHIDLCTTLTMLRHYRQVIEIADRALAAFPKNADSFRLWKSQAALNQGDIKTAWHALEGSAPDNFGIVLQRFTIALYERNYAEARRAIAARLQFPQDVISPVELFEGFVALAEGNKEKATAAFLAAHAAYEIRRKLHPENRYFHSMPAVVDAALGRKDEALRENKEATEFFSDPLHKPEILIDLAMIYCWTGERDPALAQLEDLARMPNGITYGDLLLNPAWDSLRGDARFEKIIASLVPSGDSSR